MKILVLLTDLFDALGGIQTFNRSLVKALDQTGTECGWTVSVLVLNDNGATADVSNYCTTGTTVYHGFNRSKTRFLARAIREVSDTSIVMVGHINFVPMVLGLLARNPSLRILLTVFGIDVWSRLSALQRLGLSKVHRIVSISESTRQKMADANSLNGTPVDIIPCTLEPYYGSQSPLLSREELGLPAGKMLLSTSRLETFDWYKGIDEVIRSMPAVLTKVPDAFYVLVGEGADRPRLEQLATDHGVRSHVHFVGRISDESLSSYYQACDVFVLPSTREGFGIVFLEAMHYAKACIGVCAGAVPEVIEHGVTGLLTQPSEVLSLTNSINRLLLNDNLRTSMGQAGKRRLNEEFSFAGFKSRLDRSIAATQEVIAC
jgi:phosphatidylinositol alpha-1,6-mannosyltransferase